MKIADKEGKLVIMDFNEEEAYEIACNIEKEGIRFYKRLKDNQTDADIIEMLDFMVKDEEEHLKFFEKARNQVQEQLDEETEDNDLIMSMNFGIFQPYEGIENIEEIITDSKKALKLGVLSENKAIAFYTECKQKVTDEATKKGLENIIEEENKHKLLFEEMLKRLND